jgi:hypothetical protein
MCFKVSMYRLCTVMTDVFWQMGGDAMRKTHNRLPLRAHKIIWRLFAFMLTVFVCLTIANEIIDVPHYLFGDEPTTYPQRRGEVIFELLIYIIVISSSYYYFRKKIEKEIKILEGFIPICANCKKIRQDIDWKALEDYISENSLAQFSHSICPDCIELLYPELKGNVREKKQL